MSEAVNAQNALPLEPHGRDFPYYREEPPIVSTGGWLLVIAAVAVGFAAIVVPLGFEDGVLSGWLRTSAFVGLPLLALAYATHGRWTEIFGRVRFREIRLMFGFAILNLVVSFAVGILVKSFGTVTGNAAMSAAANLDPAHQVNFFAKVGVQLLGEELITILPFLAILALCHTAAGLSRRKSVLIAWLVSAAAFGLLHLPTYNWNIVQCLVVIGSARLVLSWAYIWTKNIWVSTGAHIINDWTLAASVIFASSLVPVTP